MAITYSKGKDQPGKVANPARGQLNRESDVGRYFVSDVSVGTSHNNLSSDGKAVELYASNIARTDTLYKYIIMQYNNNHHLKIHQWSHGSPSSCWLMNQHQPPVPVVV